MKADRILLVEDDERIGSALVRALEGNGFDVRWTRAGEDAVTTVGVRRPDLVLLDLGLPDMDGLEVCRRIHAADSRIDVIMLTARDEELDLDHFPLNEISLYSTDTNALNASVTVSAADAAIQTITVKKDAGGPETAD